MIRSDSWAPDRRSKNCSSSGVATSSELLETTFGVISLSKLLSNSPLNMFWFPCPYATGIAGVTGNTGGRGRTNDTLGAAGND